MSSTAVREKHTGHRWVTHGSKEGFITVYALILLCVTMAVCMDLNRAYADKLRFIENIDEFRLINQIEVLTIARVRASYDDYRLKDEILNYQSCRISISYDGDAASITISCPKLKRHRVLRYDEIERFVTDYY